MTFQRGWTTISYAENGVVLFYNANTGASATGSVNEYGTYTNLRTMTVNPRLDANRVRSALRT